MGRTLWWLATEVMVKILSDADSRRPCAREHRVVNGDQLQGMMVWIQEDTKRDYSQTEDEKNTLVVGDGDDDGENSPAKLIQESEQMSAREDRVD
jgi:hypothetical protein